MTLHAILANAVDLILVAVSYAIGDRLTDRYFTREMAKRSLPQGDAR